ncbi:MAG: CehA/McbA family metallohydrolase [Kofleriaceae bacterium]
MTKPAITWALPGYPDDVALAAGNGRLWIAASTATLTYEGVWFGRVTSRGIADAVQVAAHGVCCRPAIAALKTGAVAIACSPGELVAAYRSHDPTPMRWRTAIDGDPVHAAVIAAGDAAWLAIEIAHGPERMIQLSRFEPTTGAILERHQIGGGATWCRWPALAIDGGRLWLAWCEGPPRTPGMVKLARWTGGPLEPWDVSGEPGEAPALAVLAGECVAVAWHRGGIYDAGDHRDASVMRTLEVAIVSSRERAAIAASPPLGAGGAEPRGEDQGWELAALAACDQGELWLVGRSTHGHHVATRSRDGIWTAAMPLDAGGWGGRGRRHALVTHRGRAWLGRRAPEGIEVGECPVPAAGVALVRGPRLRSAPSREPSRSGVLFGDLHQHTAHSDGCGSVEELWIAARDHRGLDFAAITDHDQFCRRALGPATWQLTTQVAASFDEPGRFVALAGYELTLPRYPGPGHKCVYFADRVPDRVPDRDVDALFALLRELGGIAVPHHVGWTGGDFAHHDPHVQPIWEICSVHGCYEADGACAAHPPRADHVIPGQFVRDALDAGLRFGFIASTDSHGLDWHHGIARWRNPYRAGLACVVAAEPTRAGVIAALGARRCYATTGAKIVVHAEVEGAPIGSELPANTRGELTVEVSGTAPIANIVMIDRNRERELTVEHSGTTARARAPLPEHDVANYVYVRIEQADGEAAWLSPFWIG